LWRSGGQRWAPWRTRRTSTFSHARDRARGKSCTTGGQPHGAERNGAWGRRQTTGTAPGCCARPDARGSPRRFDQSCVRRRVVGPDNNGRRFGGVHAERIDLRSADDLDAAFETVVSTHAEALFDAQNPMLRPVIPRLAIQALQHRVRDTITPRVEQTVAEARYRFPRILARRQRPHGLPIGHLGGPRTPLRHVSRPAARHRALGRAGALAVGRPPPGCAALRATGARRPGRRPGSRL